MDIEELTAALRDPAQAPEPDAVMATFARKHRRRARQRWSVAGGCAAAVLIAAAVVILPRAVQNSASPAASAGGAMAVPAAPAHRAANGAENAPAAGGAGASAGACTPVPLAQRVADAIRSGGSVVIAGASSSGTTADGQQTVVLRDVRTLRGPRIASGITGYAAAGFTSGSLRGQVFAIVLPAAAGGAVHGGPTAGTVLAAPVSGGTVRFSATNCWGTASMPLASVERLVTGSS